MLHSGSCSFVCTVLFNWNIVDVQWSVGVYVVLLAIRELQTALNNTGLIALIHSQGTEKWKHNNSFLSGAPEK